MNAVHTLRHQHRVTTLCRVLQVNRSSYYKHYAAKPSPREVENQAIRQQILSLFVSSKQRLGVRKMTHRLGVEYGLHISVGRTYRLMLSMHLPAKPTRKPVFKYVSPSPNEILLNHVNRNFNVSKPDTLWASDITYIRANGRFYYLCVILDLFSRKVVAWNLSTHIDQELSISCLKTAYDNRGPGKGLVFHSDRGSQYTAIRFREQLFEYDFLPSYSAKACPFDNAVMESFFRFLKQELIHSHSFTSFFDLKLKLSEYIDLFYNRRRPHSANNFLTPSEAEELFYLKSPG